jgi:hypothetical protein
MPAFDALSNQPKTPLRWYTDIDLQAHRTKNCAQNSGCEYALLTYNRALPKFQIWVPSGAVPTAWRVMRLNGTLEATITADLGLLVRTEFASMDYLTYNGEDLIVSLGQEPLYSELVVGGTTYYSELFRPLCPAGDPIYTGDSDAIPFGFGLWNQGATFEPWILQDYEFYLDGSVNVAGAPTNPDWAFEGAQVANYADDLLYTYTGGVWVGAVPDCRSDDQWFDSTDGSWRLFNTGTSSWQSSSDVPAGVQDGLGVSFDGSSNVDLEVVFSLDSLPCLGRWIRFDFDSQITSGGITFRIEDQDGNTVAPSPTIVVSMNFQIEAYVETGYRIRIIGLAEAVGSIGAAGFTYNCAEDSSDCHMRLRWTNCGNVGNLYYEEGFEQEYMLPSESYVARQNPTTVIEREEDGMKNAVEIFRRTETEYSIAIGYVPWHVLDALSQVPLHDTVELVLENDRGTSTLTALRLESEWDEVGGDCLANVVLYFKLEADNASVAACCTTFDPPCREACETVRGIYGVHDVGEEVVGELYLLEDGTYAEFLGLDSEEPIDENGFGAHTPCPSKLAETEQSDIPFAYYDGSEWTTLAAITNVTPEDCEAEPVTYSITASIMPRYAGQIQWTGNGTTWTNIGVPYTRAELLAGVEVEFPAAAWSMRVQVLVGDCVLGYSPTAALSCECPTPINFTPNPGNLCGNALLDGAGGTFLALTLEEIEVETRLNGGAWVATTYQVTGGGSFYSLQENGGGPTSRQWRIRMPGRSECGWIESEVFTC